MTDDDWLRSTDALSDYLYEKYGVRYSKSYLEKLRHLGKGPRFYKCKGRAIYRPRHADEWVENPEIRGPFEKSSETRKSQKDDCAASIDCEVA